jgi:hypothetical protein
MISATIKIISVLESEKNMLTNPTTVEKQSSAGEFETRTMNIEPLVD